MITDLAVIEPKNHPSVQRHSSQLAKLEQVETAMQETCMTLGDPAEFTNDQLADIVIEGVKKFRHYLPHVRSLKERFDTGDRDRLNRLTNPIKDCYSWKEFCKKHLDRCTETIREALADKKLPKVTSESSPQVGQGARCVQPDVGRRDSRIFQRWRSLSTIRDFTSDYAK